MIKTPTKVVGEGSGSAADLRYVESAARSISLYANANKIIVEKSTVPVQTAHSVERILKSNSKYHFDVLSNPEFLAEGTAINDLENPSRILIGGQPTPDGEIAVNKLADLYAHWVPKEKILKMTIWSSELSKLVANAFLAQRVSSINSVSALCEAMKADVDEVSKAVSMDPRIGSRFLHASIGFGGSCFAKDIKNLVYLCRRHGLEEVAQYWEGVLTINAYQTQRFVHEMVMRMFQNVTNKRIALLGFAFKADTGDCRETPAAYVTKYLMDECADIHVYDPRAHEEEMIGEMQRIFGHEKIDQYVSKYFHKEVDPYEACEGAHAIAIMTEWKEFKTYDYKKMYDKMVKPAFIFDGRNILDIPKMKEIGFEVYVIGKGRDI